jgi:hypothetical protein
MFFCIHIFIYKYNALYIYISLYIEDDNRFIFLTEIKTVGKPETDIDV